MRARVVAACVLALSATVVDAQAPQSVPRPKSNATDFRQLAAETERQLAGVKPNEHVPPELAKKDLEDRAAYIVWQRQFARESWSWHLFSTKLLMFVVLAIVAFGLLITYIQFTRDLRRRPRRHVTAKVAKDSAAESTADTSAVTEAVTTVSTLKLSPTGVEVTSQVIGLLVLAFSLAFFYLYVKEVYPMHEIELQREASKAPAAASDPARAEQD